MAARLTGERWIWVSLPYATFLVGVKDGNVTDAPPIVWKVMRRIGTEEGTVAAHYRRQGARFRPLPSPATTRTR